MQYFNIIEGLEASEYTWSKVAPRKVTGTATGETETLNFTGSTLAMKSLAEHYLAEGSQTMQVSCSVTRGEADMARLQVQRTYFLAPEDDSENPENKPPADSVGSSESCPMISVDYIEVQQPILTHPMVQDMGLNEVSPQWIALRMLSQGADMAQTFTWTPSDGNPVVYTVGEGLSGVPGNVQTLVGGKQFFLDVQITANLKYEIDATSEVPDFGEVPRIEQPSGGMKLAAGRNWLFIGGNITKEGDKVMVTKIYKASNAGGWDETIYGS